jgi:hypothetical protein
LNLTHDPTTAKDTVVTLTTLNQRTFGLWTKLIDQALPETHRTTETARALFDVLRGLAIGQEFTDSIPGVGPPKQEPDPVRATLIRAFTSLIEQSPAPSEL